MVLHIAFDFHLIWILYTIIVLFIGQCALAMWHFWHEKINEDGFPYVEVGHMNSTTGRWEIDPSREHEYATRAIRPIYRPLGLLTWKIQKLLFRRKWAYWHEYLEMARERHEHELEERLAKRRERGYW